MLLPIEPRKHLWCIGVQEEGQDVKQLLRGRELGQEHAQQSLSTFEALPAETLTWASLSRRHTKQAKQKTRTALGCPSSASLLGNTSHRGSIRLEHIPQLRPEQENQGTKACGRP